MRPVLTWIGILGLSVGLGTIQGKKKPQSPRFDPPAVISTVEAIYPLQSVASGTVVLEVTLDNAGKITDVRVVRGIPSLTESAERSIRQWKFRPAQLDGEPVHSKVTAAFSFVPPNVGPRIGRVGGRRGAG
jgi:TonB family protein